MTRYFFILFLGFAFGAAAQPFHDEIQAFKRQDSTAMPAQGQYLFVGSSSFRLWKDVQAYFPGAAILNRGFGGATLPDLLYYEKDVVRPYHPKKIVIYCGENDFATSDTIQAKHVLARFKKVFTAIRKDYPRTPIVFVSMKPSPSRQRLMPQIDAGNKLIQQFLAHKKNTAFVDIYHAMLDEKGNPRAELFLEDNLHMNRQGYQIWQKALAPLITN